MEISLVYTCVILLTLTLVKRSEGHGYMLEPPARSSMWRRSFSTPINYDDNSIRCEPHQTNCGVCGNKENESGGRFATGTIGRRYTTGQTANVTVVLTANHKGYFQFALCPNTPETEDCFSRRLLQLDNGQTRYNLQPDQKGEIKMRVKLPPGVICSHCVLRWFYNTGNSWGHDVNGQGCLGCGAQERYYGCADVSISGRKRRSLVDAGRL